MQEMILILDFGSQYTQLIARRVRELNTYCEIHPYNEIPELGENVKGVILSGSPFSALDKNAPEPDLTHIKGYFPLLGVCYGAQYIAHTNGGVIEKSKVREYGRAHLTNVHQEFPLFKNVHNGSQVWMSHGDSIMQLPDTFEITASTREIPVAGYHIKNEDTYGIQFHPEVYHTKDGMTLLHNFVVDICGCHAEWTPDAFIETTIDELKVKIGDEQVVLGLSGGVDSTVAAVLLSEAIGDNLHCIFVNNGLLRKYEFENVLHQYEEMGLNVKGVDASDQFLAALAGVKDPELKRKAIGRVFIEVFDREAHAITDVNWLGQGTIYPDVIESISVKGPSATIKSHHNVGGLPDFMKLKIVEPLRMLFKDEVRRVGRSLGIDEELLGRHPFPGPGLAIRILSDVTPEKVAILQEVDHLFVQGLKDHKL
jgi:GMP synthase (glutamine-hydrolysing)